MSELNERSFNYYRNFLALKLHFKENNFNFFKNEGKTRVKRETYLGRRDRYFFERSANSFNTQKFLDKCIVQIKKNPSFFIKEIFTPENESTYLKRKGFLESFLNSFDREISSLVNYCLKNKINKEALLKGNEEEKPLLFSLYVNGIISDETFICIDKVFGVTEELARFSLDPLVDRSLKFLKKYYPFVLMYLPKKEEIEKILKNNFCILQ